MKKTINNNESPVGIVGYGVYVPRWRVSVDELAQAHNSSANRIKAGLGLEEKTVPGKDEDSATMAVMAAKHALGQNNIDAKNIGALYVGSESHSYAVKPTATIVGQALGCTEHYFAADLEFACKAGTSTLQIVYALIKANLTNYGLAIGADVAQAKSGDVLEYSAGAGSAAFIIGSDATKIIATIDATLSHASNLPDFWRREGQPYPQHAGRFTGEPAYLYMVTETTKHMLEHSSLAASDIDHVIFHQPNGKFPLAAAQRLGFTKKQLEHGLLVAKIGNCYSASSMIGLAAVLDKAQPGQRILLTSYGSGGGCDSFVFTTTPALLQTQNYTSNVDYYMNRKTYVSYAEYKKRNDF